MQWKLTTTQPLCDIRDIPAGLLHDFAMVDTDVQIEQRVTDSVAVPPWHALTSLVATNNDAVCSTAHQHAQHKELAALHEWLGALALGISPQPTEHLQSNNNTLVSVAASRTEGLWMSEHVGTLLQGARHVVASGDVPWFAVSVRGPQHAPVSWTGTCSSPSAVHSMGMVGGGENEYVVLLLPEDVWLLFVASGEGDQLHKLW